LHPSRQVGGYEQYLVDTHPAFSTGTVGVASCAYLHNAQHNPSSFLHDARFADLLGRYPLYEGDRTDELVDYLVSHVGEPDDGSILERIAEARFHPHRRLLDHVAKMIRREPSFTLLDEQVVAYNAVVAQVKASALTPGNAVFLIRGGPGTGKSVIAINLVADLAASGARVVHATGSRAFTENLRRLVGPRATSLFSWFRNLRTLGERLDVVVLDEAHRIRETSTDRFSRPTDRTGKAQIAEIFDAARVTVFFIDDLQVVRPGEVGSSDLIREEAAKRGLALYEFELEAQFRANGSDAFIQWVDNTLGVARTPQVLWDSADPFEVRVVDSVHELEAGVRARAAGGSTARLVAGFCWPWSSPAADGTLVPDVVEGDWSMPWNARADVTRLAPGIPKSHYWASDPKGIDQVGCVYTAQGFEFDYVGVIWGEDLVYRPGRGWVGQPEYSKDGYLRRSRKSPDEFTGYVKNVYRVLLTRGLRGCYVYFRDQPTRDFVLSRIEGGGLLAELAG
ncbi:MAG TPA: DUF2075 domain-containing protein, partial [Candidatus Limnocylindrales bacterium]|nr:DUF2075 domain-containing protein [Candidatus Limnocylindrales bacterium]